VKAKREWGPTGVVPQGHTYQRLSNELWEQVQLVVKEKTSAQPPDAFRKSLDAALMAGQASQYLHGESTPKKTRANLAQALEAARALTAALEGLDGNSKSLLDEIEGGAFLGLINAAVRAQNLLTQVQTKASELPTTKAGIKDFAPRNLGYYLAWAIRWHIGAEHVSGYSKSLYVELYQVLAKSVRYAATVQAAQVALQFVRERDTHEPDGPLRV
jgi:hypothetical protein